MSVSCSCWYCSYTCKPTQYTFIKTCGILLTDRVDCDTQWQHLKHLSHAASLALGLCVVHCFQLPVCQKLTNAKLAISQTISQRLSWGRLAVASVWILVESKGFFFFLRVSLKSKSTAKRIINLQRQLHHYTNISYFSHYNWAFPNTLQLETCQDGQLCHWTNKDNWKTEKQFLQAVKNNIYYWIWKVWQKQTEC